MTGAGADPPPSPTRHAGDSVGERPTVVPASAPAEVSVAGEGWHAVPAAAVAERLSADARRGLSPAEAQRRLASYGPNRLPDARSRGLVPMLLAQLASPVVLLLIASGTLSLAIGARSDAIAIFAVVALNAALGSIHEHGAERALLAMRRREPRRALAIRAGVRAVVPAESLVPGDLVRMEAGERVPADVRIVRAAGMRTVESALTGESDEVEKDPDARVDATAPVAERPTLAYAGTTVSAGVGEGIVVRTGAATEMGRIAALVRDVRRGATPLERELRRLGTRLMVAAGAAVTMVFALALLRGHSLREALPAAVGLAVAAVPEGLPAVVTIALAVGVGRMARRGVLIRHLPAVETLGATTVICVDKTGTLTTGRMEATEVATDDGVATIASDRPADRRAAASVLGPAAVCTTATLAVDGSDDHHGDPTEIAILAAAARVGATPEGLERTRVVPFDAERKRMSVLRRAGGSFRLDVKGAPESVLPRCVRVASEDGVRPLRDEDRARLDALGHDLAARGLRVLAVAAREVDDAESADAPAGVLESDLTFLGYVGFMDPPRVDSAPAVAACREAGIRTVMITGDQRGTALAIARRIGIASEAGEVVSGADALDDEALAARARSTTVYARTSPEAKLRIVRAHQAAGEVVAMTGDGVNDAPALRGADVGVALGSGTDAAKDAASMVVTDDRFSSIVAAVAEGRRVHDNVRKSLLYVLSGNAGEIALVASAVAVGWPLPLLPVQLLWINLLTDSLPAVALATEPGETHLLSRPPRRLGEGVADASFVRGVLASGALIAACAAAAFAIGLRAGPLPRARTMAFSTLVAAETLRAFAARSRREPVWEIGIASNVRLLVVALATLGVQLVLHAWAPLGSVAGVVPLAPADLATIAALGVVPFTVLEVGKLVRRALGPGRGRGGSA